MATAILRPIWSAPLARFRDLITGRFISAAAAAPFLRAYPSVRGAMDVVIRDAYGRFVPSRFFGGEVLKHFPSGGGKYAAVERVLPGPPEDFLYRTRDVMHGLVQYRIEGGPLQEIWVTMPKGEKFDVEGTGDEGGFLLGVIYDWGGWRVFRSRESMRKALLAHRYRGCRIYAHNLEYDFGCLFQDDLEGWSVYRLHSRLIKCMFRDGHKSVWHFHDTGNLSYFISLAALGKILGMEKLETPDWIKSDGSSDLDKTKITDDQWRDLETYCVRDAMICYKYALHIQETINVLDEA